MQPPEIRLVRADNPSPLTGSGTNSWILGRGEVVIVDPGPNLDSHFAALLAAIAGEKLCAILLTHAHLDHSALIPRLVAATGAPVLAYGPADAGRSAVMQDLAAQGMRSGEGADDQVAPDRCLSDGESLDLAGLAIEALHLPGHMGCHMGFALGDVLVSGDHVMGWSTSLVSPPDGDMGDYMASLERLAARRWSRFLPGHGPQVADPAARLSELITHRQGREAAVLASLRGAGPADAMEIARRVYLDTPRHLLPAAARNVLAHLIDLRARGAVAAAEGPLNEAIFAAL